MKHPFTNKVFNSSFGNKDVGSDSYKDVNVRGNYNGSHPDFLSFEGW